MNDLDFILSLMKQNTNALGFIPRFGVENQYIGNGRYIIQSAFGKPVGYILHGKPSPGGVLSIAQHVIEYDQREKGHGMDAIGRLIERAKLANCRSIVLKCAEDLPANYFWRMAGFEQTAILSPANQRRRKVNVYTMDLWPGLFKLKEQYREMNHER